MKIKEITNGMLGHLRPSIFWRNGKFTLKILEDLKSLKQRGGQTVFDHTMDVLDCLKIKNEITLLSALMHDTGKLYTKTINDNGINFWDHEYVSSQIIWSILPSWEVPIDTIDIISRIIKTHMIDIKCNMSKSKIRKFIADVGHRNINNWFVLRQADAESYANYKSTPFNQYMKSVFYPFKNKVISELKEIYCGKTQFDPSIIGDALDISGE
jgi:tRNA nucleotidyltransferase (CCA-adding enzyme)